MREASGVSAGPAGESVEQEEEVKGKGEESSAAGEQPAEASSDKEAGKSGSSGGKGKKVVGSREGGAKDSLPRDLLLVTGTARNPVSERSENHSKHEVWDPWME